MSEGQWFKAGQLKAGMEGTVKPSFVRTSNFPKRTPTGRPSGRPKQPRVIPTGTGLVEIGRIELFDKRGTMIHVVLPEGVSQKTIRELAQAPNYMTKAEVRHEKHTDAKLALKRKLESTGMKVTIAKNGQMTASRTRRDGLPVRDVAVYETPSKCSTCNKTFGLAISLKAHYTNTGHKA